MPSRVPGGSSAGTAAAVAASMAVLGLAEETGGSIQHPASAQDLVGIKPTIGLVPNAGVVPLSGNRSVVGPIARCVRDAALCLDVLAGYTAEDPKTLAGVGKQPPLGYTAKLHTGALKGVRLGLYGAGWRTQPLSAEAQALYARAADELKAQGAILVDDPFVGSGFAGLRRTVTPDSNSTRAGWSRGHMTGTTICIAWGPTRPSRPLPSLPRPPPARRHLAPTACWPICTTCPSSWPACRPPRYRLICQTSSR